MDQNLVNSKGVSQLGRRWNLRLVLRIIGEILILIAKRIPKATGTAYLAGKYSVPESVVREIWDKVVRR